MKKCFVLFVSVLLLLSFVVVKVSADADLHYYYGTTRTIVANDLYEINNPAENSSFTFSFTPTITGYYVFETYGLVDTSVTIGSTNYDLDKGYSTNEVVGFQGTANVAYTIVVYAIDVLTTGDDVTVQVRRQTISVFAVDLTNILTTTANITTVNGFFGTSGSYANRYAVETQTNFSDYTITTYANLKGLRSMNSDILIFSSHGDTGVIKYVSGTSFVSLSAAYLPDLSNVNLAIWASCLSAAGGSSSVANAAINKGARVSIGWTDTISAEWSNIFIGYLLTRMIDNQSDTISELVTDAISDSIAFSSEENAPELGAGDTTLTSYLVVGDTNAVLTLNNVGQVNDKDSTTNFIPVFDDIDPVLAPTISVVNVTTSSVTLMYTNSSLVPVKVYAEKTDSTPDVYIGVVLQPGQTYNHTYSGLLSDTVYYFYVKFVDYYRTDRSSSVTSRMVRTYGDGGLE